MTLVDLLLHEIMNLVGWKRSDKTFALHHAVLADPCFDSGKGYKRFDALTGFFQISFS